MDPNGFPKRLASVVEAPEALLTGLSITPSLVLRSAQAYFAIYDNEQQVKQLRTESAELKKLAPYDVVATAAGTDYDFVSRYFWPANGGDEDPVTGSIHAGLSTLLGRQIREKPTDGVSGLGTGWSVTL